MLRTLRALLSPEPAGTSEGLSNSLIGGFSEGDDALAARVTRVVQLVAEEEATRLGKHSSVEDAAERQGSDGAQLFVALRDSRLGLVRSLARSMGQVADRFEAGGTMAAGARVMLEGAVMAAETQPYPLSQRQMSNWQAREWDWEAFAYA